MNDRLMSLRPPLRGSKFATIISSYAPPIIGSGKRKVEFYENVHILLSPVTKMDKLVVHDDFAVSVGTDCAA
nr:unnamed protein product [Spirometra erinaceieuropaei]